MGVTKFTRELDHRREFYSAVRFYILLHTPRLVYYFSLFLQNLWPCCVLFVEISDMVCARACDIVTAAVVAGALSWKCT